MAGHSKQPVPAQRVKPPSTSHAKMELLNEEEVQTMLIALEGEPLKYRTIILLALDSGLRLGELMALQWNDIDMENGTLRVTKSNQAIHGRGVFTKAPKNQSSVRRLALSKSTLQLLQQHKQQQAEEKTLLGDKWHEGSWIFTQWNGIAMYPATPSQWFRRFLERHGLPHMPFHGLRHLSATLLIASGIPLKNVSSRLGHADIRTTANIYSDALQSIDQRAAETMDAFLQGCHENKREK